MKILVTGSAGFIGMHIALRSLAEGHQVFGIDNLNSYYDVNLKTARLNELLGQKGFQFAQVDLTNVEDLRSVFLKFKPDVVINLAAQAGVRYSLENPESYIESNIVGFTNLLEECKQHEISHLIYASSSSIYGLNENVPFSEASPTEHPVALYGATKKANELIAHAYSHLFQIPTTGLRFFTVYGPWGRPDMALFKFTKAILEGEKIDIYNHGNMVRDFTYIDDVVECIYRLIYKPAIASQDFSVSPPELGESSAPWKIFNVGNGQPTRLMDYILSIEEAVGIEADKNYLDKQKGDVLITSADTSKLSDWIDFSPNTPINYGVEKFVKWYRAFYSQ